MTENNVKCTCGHPWFAHEHLRPGNDCSQCRCLQFKKVRWYHRFMPATSR